MTDNWSQGGYCAPVDVDTGTVDRLNVLEGHSRTELKRHPETDAPVAGVDVPYWDEVCGLVRTAAVLHRDAPFVGWDVVVSDAGPVLLEGNARPGKQLLQLEGGILEDPRVRLLFESADTT